jgi:hypothetical protein
VEVRVAFVDDPNLQGGYDMGGLEDQIPYDQLPSVTLAVDADESLGSVLQRTAHELEVVEPGGQPFFPIWVAFYEPIHEAGYRPTGEVAVLTLVDNDGCAVWGVGVTDDRVTMDALERAKLAGLVDGDIHRPYLIRRPAYGNGVLPDWQELVLGFIFLREAVSLAADLLTLAPWTRAQARRVLDRIRSLPDIIGRKSPDWTSRNGWPSEVDHLIRRTLWTTEELARLLDISVADVAALLSGRGMVQDERTGYWHMGDDAESRKTRELYEFALTHEWSHVTEAGDIERVRTEIRRTITRGMEPDADTS